jgi:MFS transporter, SP family, major inositol transporter
VAGAEKAMAATFNMTPVNQGLVTCMLLIGAAVGAVSGGYVADRLGRRPTLFLSGAFTFVFSLASAAPPYLWLVALLRVGVGLGVGLASSVCPLYIAEMSPPRHVEWIGVLFQLAITLGILVSYLVPLGVQHLWFDWQTMFACGAVPGWFFMGVVVVVCMT